MAFDSIFGIILPKNSHLDESYIFSSAHMILLECRKSPAFLVDWILVFEWYKVCGCYVGVYLVCGSCSLTSAIRFAPPNFCYISKSTMMHGQKILMKNWMYCDLVMISGNACL